MKNERRGFLIGMCGFALLWPAPYALADVVILSNDVRMEGVLVDNTDGELRLRVSEAGIIFLDTQTVAGVERATQAGNEALIKSWEEDRRRTEKEQRAQDAFAAAQAAKGLVLYQDEWLKPEEAARRAAPRSAVCNRFIVPGV